VALQLRMPGTTREDGTCPTPYGDVARGGLVKHGCPITDLEAVPQLQHVLKGELFVRLPHALPARLAPKE
jgi:hypothetical protein